ncbi:MAG: hypothetical protein LC754_17430 [Acidobacteria bacterium]|nr:hypothetical protein [Acidobacteriota bacterium]
MRKTLQASVLALVMSVSAYAGEMQFPVTGTPPPQSPPPSTQQTSTDGATPDGEPDMTTEIVLIVLSSILPLS